MSMKYNPNSRRMFLQGMGKFALTIPVLPSLLPRKAQAAAMDIPPRFIAMSSQNGAVPGSEWLPAGLPSANTRKMYNAYGGGFYRAPEHFVNWGPINFSATSGISSVFDQKFNGVVPKMNFLRGLDWANGAAGNHVGPPLLGNCLAATSNLSFLNSYPTIDQVMAYSSGFYPGDGSGYIRSLVLNAANANSMSMGFQNPFLKTGSISYVPAMFNPKLIFDQLFPGGGSGGASPTPYIDSVMASFRKVRDGRAISSEDRQTLQSHIDLFADLEKKLTAALPPQSLPACINPVAPISRLAVKKTDLEIDIKTTYQLINDMIVLALKCQRTRVVTNYINVVPGYQGLGGIDGENWHWASHYMNNADPDKTRAINNLKYIYKWINDNIVYDLISKMDSNVEANGKTMLDNSLVQLSSASMNGPHTTLNMPMVLFGSAGGFIKTGFDVDYLNRNITQSGKTRTGILINQYFATAMHAMRLTPNDYSMTNLGLLYDKYAPGAPGYGEYRTTNPSLDMVFAGPRSTVGNNLQIIT